MTVMHDATQAQVAASNPVDSTWLSANAGSGKTRVLIDRVARLLLRGVEPQRILCLTYTKAAATEMQNRLFKRLGEWAMMPDTVLRAVLADLGESNALDASKLGQARRLFARAIDTPGGLRIQTIHSFCAMLLRRFPLEAGVSPQFTEMDDRAGQMLRDDILEVMADGPEHKLVRRLAGIVAEGNLPGLIHQITGLRAGFSAPMSRTDLLAKFDLPAGFDEQALLGEVFLGGESELIAELMAALAIGNPAANGLDYLAGIQLARPGLSALKALEKTFLVAKDSTTTGIKAGTARIGVFPRSATAKIIAHRMPQIQDLMRRVEAAMPRRLALNAVDRTMILHDFAQAFLAHYASGKAARGWLDFDDLIHHAKRLLTEPGLAAWVLYRLDGGIDHVLVDEAQDTSPDQWQVIQSLTDEFFVGENHARMDRTIFVVGDKKQSIYSFQGADVAAFDWMQQHFAARTAGVDRALVPGELRHSFRSSANILRLVDYVFQGDVRAAIGGKVQHFAFHEDQPGRVDLWPVVPPTSDPKDENAFDPVDIVGEASAQATLATMIATEIKAMLAAGTQIRVGGKVRRVHAGDILILVRRRSTLFSEIIRACKKAELPIAGADRLRLGAEIAVKDLGALLAFLATPEDDLSLATVLRSPLCGLTEAELYALAQPRKGYLWQALREGEGHVAVQVMLADLMAQADYMRPYELIERTLTRHDGRRRLLARLGPEAEDGIDELLQQALAHERRNIPSLTSFLVALQTSEVEVKRQADGAGGRIRVMTVHGAKGLEAPVVILPDTADHMANDRDRTLLLADGTVMDRPPADDLPPALKSAKAAHAAREAEERLRLLYVAMTRAQSWLIVAAAGKVTQPQCWYTLVQQAMAELGPNAPMSDGRLRHDFGDWPEQLGHGADAESFPRIDLPDWAHTPAPEPPLPVKLLSPSGLGGAKALPGEAGLDAELAKEQGTALHLLLEHLPGSEPTGRAELAAALVPDAALRMAVWPQVMAILADDALAHIFGPRSLAEVALTAELDGRRLAGTVDRLVVTDNHVLAVDFKSNRVIPDRAEKVPDGILAQMGAYAEVLSQIYPDRPVQVAVLWTSVPRLMPLDRDIVRAALQSATKA